MELYNYERFIDVINNVNFREEREKELALLSLKEKCESLEIKLLHSGLLEDWSSLKDLCASAHRRLCVSNQWTSSIGYILGHPESYGYCHEYLDNGTFMKVMSSGSSWSDEFGFKYKNGHFEWITTHSSEFRLFDGFKSAEAEYNTKIELIEKFFATYEDYRDFQLKKIYEKFEPRLKAEDFVK